MRSASPSLARLVAGGVGEIRDPWRRRFFASTLRLASGTASDLPPLGEPVAQRLFEAMQPAEDLEASPVDRLVPGGTTVRELERAVAFAGAQGAAVGASGYDVAALLFALRDILQGAATEPERVSLGAFFEWLVVVAMEAYASAGRASADERAQAELERGTPVVLLPAGVPAAFLVGDPQAAVLESIFGRLALLAARFGARVLLIDGGGLANPRGAEVQAALRGIFSHPDLRERTSFYASGVDDAAAAEWKKWALGSGVRLEAFEGAQEAIGAAMAGAGYALAPGVPRR